ncbi:helix-turn-helix domain-containing protein [Fictibacillus norfolkensis]|uniref:Helix-turn-helix transcriptional regulator n=1 Tax=Fictibacillus norfolkensis TaxID=2762233 RepID=A0ABR8SRW6_9BACL|nr:helix-turn-helix transcriptional regulator [Fictibacillus norfolkensis]MBD7966250.1 helix-turn-helix transcriptional regulator [Fictibacillus norfolkensis]
MEIRLKSVDEFNKLLLRKGYSKRALANKGNMGQATIHQISKGVRKPSPPVAKRILEALEVEFDEIFTIEK